MTAPCPHCASRLTSVSGAAPTRRTAHPGEAERRRHLLLRTGDVLRLVRVDDIDWVEADGHHVRICVAGQTIIVRGKLTALEQELDPILFLRIHRSTIVNLDRIVELRHWFGGDYNVVLRDGKVLKLSRSYRSRLEPYFLAGPDAEPPAAPADDPAGDDSAAQAER
ncbi:MAG TPA: LytTR family DNA-binding domain-containing protein [Longimicrobium sp.]|jgi:two-component system LytT family response regulator|uniref:LytR/AlgR family response regulator transcription factor n=1 Tax=Longimicrobium sp. TaxID=2029185 RepID=UPI002ED91598